MNWLYPDLKKKRSKHGGQRTNTSAADVNLPASTDDTFNDLNADKAVDTDKATEKDGDPDWKQSSNDANEEFPEDKDIEYDEDEPPVT